MTALTKTDTELDAEIVSHVEDLRRALGSAVEAAWVLGHKLTERKRRLQHGQWIPYLDRIGLPPRTAQEAMAVGTKYAEAAHLPGTIRGALEASPVERRRAETLRLWPGLAPRMGDTDLCTVVDAYARITAWLFDGGSDEPSRDEMAWAMGVEALFDREFL